MKKPGLTLDAALVQDDLPLEVAPKLFVGSIHAAFNLEALTANGITHILNASRLPPTFPKQFTYLSVEIRDKDGSNILSCIPSTNIFIEAGLDHGGVLVHCFGGKSRSPAFIAAYLMSSNNFGFDEAFRIIKAARPAMEINLGFEYQLRAYAAAKFDVYIAQQLLLRARIRELHFIRGDPSVLNSDTNVSDHLSMAKLSTAHLLANQQHLQQRLDQITAKHQADIAAAQHKNSDDRDRQLRNKRSFQGVGEEDSSMDVDGTDGDESTTMRSPQLMGEHKASRFDPEESVDSAISTMSNDSTGRHAKLMKEHFGDDVIKSTGSLDEKDASHRPTPTVTFHTGSSDTSTPVGGSNSSSSGRKGRSGRANHGSRGSGSVEAKNPSCRLSRPGSTVVRVIPPLRGLEREFKCSWCNAALFHLASVLRTDIPMVTMLEDFVVSLQACSPGQRRERDDGPDPEDSYLAQQQQQHQQQQQFLQQQMPSTMRGGGAGRGISKSFNAAFQDDDDHAASHSASAAYASRQPLPPIRSASDPPQSSGLHMGSLSTDDNDGGSGVPSCSATIDNYGGEGTEMEVEAEEFLVPMPQPLKTSRAAKQSAGFSFDFSDDPPHDPVPALDLKAPRGSGGGARGGFNNNHVHFQAEDRQPISGRQRGDDSHGESGNGDGVGTKISPRDYPPVAKTTPRSMLPALDHSHFVAPATATAILLHTPGLPNSPRLEPIAGSKNSPPKSFFAALYPGLNPPSHGRLCFDISPRVVIPPHRQSPSPPLVDGAHAASSSSSGGMSSLSTAFVSRPASAEKRRWLARVSLLRDGSNHKVMQLADQDDGVAALLASNHEEKYFYVEYLDWMGREIFVPSQDYGDICCPSCKRVIGCWNWTPSLRLLRNGLMEAPLFLIHKNVVHHTDVDFDATPSGTPRIQDDFEGRPADDY